MSITDVCNKENWVIIVIQVLDQRAIMDIIDG
jgi:hypothetical protein